MRTDVLGRVAGVVVALALGLLVGTVCTFKYRLGLTGAPPQLPIGLVLGLLTVLLVLLAMRVLLERREYAVATAVGVVVAVAVFTMKGPGGSVVVVGDLAGEVWTVGPAVVAVLVLLVPRAGRRRPGRARRSSLGGASDAAGARDADGILVAPVAGTGKRSEQQ